MISIAQLIALGVALVTVIRRRFQLGIVCLVLYAYLFLAMATALPVSGQPLVVTLPGLLGFWHEAGAGHALLPGGAVLAEWPIVFTLITVALSVIPLVVAWRQAAAVHPEAEIAKERRSIVRALLALSAVDVISLIILVFAGMMSSPY